MEFPGGLVVRPLQGAQVPIPGWGIKILQLQDVAKNQKATRQPDMHHWIKMAHGLLLLFERLNVCFSPVCSFFPHNIGNGLSTLNTGAIYSLF